MTAERMREEMARLEGYEVVHHTLCLVTPDKYGEPELTPVMDVPDYTLDLNAVARVVGRLNGNQLLMYWDNLANRLGGTASIDATATQRCEAILRATGKWEEA